MHAATGCEAAFQKMAGVGEFMTLKSGTPFDLCQSIGAKVAFYLLP